VRKSRFSEEQIIAILKESEAGTGKSGEPADAAGGGAVGEREPTMIRLPRLQMLLLREGWQVNHKRGYQLYWKRIWGLRRKQGRKRSGVRQPGSVNG